PTPADAAAVGSISARTGGSAGNKAAFMPHRQFGAYRMARPIPASSILDALPSILDALPSEVSRGLFAHGRSISLEAEQTLFLAGDEGDGCYRVERSEEHTS